MHTHDELWHLLDDLKKYESILESDERAFVDRLLERDGREAFSLDDAEELDRLEIKYLE